MRGKFVLVVAAGVAAAAGWSLVRRQGEAEVADRPEPGTGALESMDVGPSPPAPQPSVRPQPPTPAPAPAESTDPISAARSWTASGGPDLRDEAARTRATQLGDALLARAETLPTGEGTEARLLARRLFAALHDCDAATRAERDLAFDRSVKLFGVLVKGAGAPPSVVLRHKVEAGQSVWALAKGPWRTAGASVAPGFVLWLNDVPDARRVRVGQTLKVPLERLSILVRKRSFELTVLLGGAPVERFRVAVGPDAKTPVGRFQAGDCLKNPDWYMNGRRIPFGSPEHIIGTRWIGFTGAPEAAGIGIHGTNDAGSIGTAASLGCVRMTNADVERLFEWMSAGTPIEVRD